jgi:hypothetical protein
MILRALESELHAWVKIRQEKYLMKDRAINNLTLDDFMAICNKAIDEGRSSTDSTAMYASNSKTDKSNKSTAQSSAQSSKESKRSQKSTDSKPRVKKFPPKDMDWQEYARQWREFAAQWDDDFSLRSRGMTVAYLASPKP